MRVFVSILSILSLWSFCEDTTYYVSSSEGDDNNTGLTELDPFETIDRVNALILEPGDRVLFKCGDIWRGEVLEITESGIPANPIVFSTYPSGCANKPVISGAFPIAGWTSIGSNLYQADLSAGANAGLFPNGINQLFRNGERLLLGRWPNVDEGDGYSEIDAQPEPNMIQDFDLPAGNWTGATVHIKGMRWYIINRIVNAHAGSSLTLNATADCWGGDCTDWGYFINRHPDTLDQDGEWFFDSGTQLVSLYSTTGMPTNMEGSTILDPDFDPFSGGIVLGRHLYEHITDVIIENFEIRAWYQNGITTPTNLETAENARIVIQNNDIIDVDSTGINLQTWVWNAAIGPNGWRGGDLITVENNFICRANHMGIDTYTVNSSFIGNHLQDIGMITLAGQSGIGCGDDSSGGYCTEFGDGMRIKIDEADYSGRNNLVQYNTFERIGYCGIDLFGRNNELRNNVIVGACTSKGDCGGVRTFGSGDMATTPVHDVVLADNIIVDTIGNTDGTAPQYRDLFGIGLYLDHYSRDMIVSGNTVISSTITGVLFQNATGELTDNVIFNNASGTMYAPQVRIVGSPSHVDPMAGNVLYSRQEIARTLSIDSLGQLANSDFNYFFNPYEDRHISANGMKNLLDWQSYSGMDANSTESWFQLAPQDPPLSRIFYNDTQSPTVVSLGGLGYRDLNQTIVMGSILLDPFESRVLIWDPDLSGLKGDVDDNQRIDVLDGTLLINILAGSHTPTPYQEWAADVDDDGSIDQADQSAFCPLVWTTYP